MQDLSIKYVVLDIFLYLLYGYELFKNIAISALTFFILIMDKISLKWIITLFRNICQLKDFDKSVRNSQFLLQFP